MCGIVAYIGRSAALPVLMDGLRRLEYRGYDSAGVAILESGQIHLRKSVGRIANLAEEIEKNPVSGSIGISHTRWATHGAVTRENAHPHTDKSGRLHLVHNGVIENYQILRDQLIERGHIFHSQTDTEVLAHLVGEAFDRATSRNEATLVEAVRQALRQVIGTYGISVVHADVPGVIIGARRGSPLVLGIGKNEHFLASDVSAIVAHTRDVVFLNDYEIIALQAEGFEITTVSGNGADYQVSKVEYSAESVDKGHYPHYMLKEIHEQPNSVRDALRGRLCLEEATAKLGGLNMSNADLRSVDRIVLVGCGTAFHSALAGEYLIESLAHIPVECEFASEFRYRNIPLDRDTLVFVVSQSGETADTLAALRESQRKGHRTLGICNNVASTIARESDGGVYMHAGPEIGVAATKSFTSQLTIFALLGLLLGRIRHLSHSDGLEIIAAMEKLPDLVARTLQLDSQIAAIAKKYAHSKSFLFMGRQGKLPDEEEQYQAYKRAVEGMQGMPVTIRTIDVGADKPLDDTRRDEGHLNPALGLRAIRWSLAEPSMFLTQLRAILRAAAHGKVNLLIPMLAHASEIRQTLALVDFARAELDNRGTAYGPVALGAGHHRGGALAGSRQLACLPGQCRVGRKPRRSCYIGQLKLKEPSWPHPTTDSKNARKNWPRNAKKKTSSKPSQIVNRACWPKTVLK